MSLSACAADYAKCLANPFTGPLACIPDFPVLYSSKQRVWAKGSFSTGTLGLGFIVANPLAAAANDLTCVWTSSAIYALNSVDITNVNTVTVLSNSQYANANFGPTPANIQCRIVGAGLRIRYMGSELNRGGYKIALLDPTHDSLNNATVATMRAEPTSVEFAVKREWTQVLYRPVYNDEMQFADAINTAAPYMAFLVQSATATTSLEYEYEFSVVYEFQGRTIKSMTPSHSDPTGFAAVNASSLTSPALIPNNTPDKQRENMSLQTAAHYVGQGISSVSSGLETASGFVKSGAKVVSQAHNFWKDIEEIFSMAAPLLFLL